MIRRPTAERQAALASLERLHAVFQEHPTILSPADGSQTPEERPVTLTATGPGGTSTATARPQTRPVTKPGLVPPALFRRLRCL